MQLLQAIVLHKTFGRGEVIKQDEETVTVSFPKPYGKKKFLFPTAFQQHLTLDDESLSTEMKKILKEQKIKISIEQKRLERSKRFEQFDMNIAEKAKAASNSKKNK